MSSNLYLFDPQKIQGQTGEKPLVQIIREAELARAEGSAQLIRSVIARVFGDRKTAASAGVAPARLSAADHHEDHRLAA